ncbi:hypothetical protein PCANC_23614 [Puccinia coronata f. sp. avenae]|uniref:Uncharacterized protein n=1 Tax=Puccinia coronata f. sp. avenae TaxID=200324 RepID=A0A2N5S8L4_9BASI|nr:hypothetical protein PCANC_23614 [Puccinia coronata f. sp. avenae]
MPRTRSNRTSSAPSMWAAWTSFCHPPETRFSLSVELESIFHEPHSSLSKTSTDSANALKSFSTRSAIRSPFFDHPEFRPNPSSHSTLKASCHPLPALESTRADEIRAEHNVEEGSASKISATKTEDESEDVELLNDLIECTLPHQISARLAMPGTGNNRLQKRSRATKRNCSKRRWKRMRKRIQKAYRKALQALNKARQTAIIWLLKILKFFKFKAARGYLRKIRLAQRLGINW